MCARELLHSTHTHYCARTHTANAQLGGRNHKSAGDAAVEKLELMRCGAMVLDWGVLMGYDAMALCVRLFRLCTRYDVVPVLRSRASVL